MQEKREVIIIKKKWDKVSQKVICVPIGKKGFFHGFGLDYEETDAGMANFSVAIIEMPDGFINLYPAANIQFIKPLGEDQ